MGDAETEYATREPVDADSEAELKSTILNLDSGEEHNFFKKDMVLGNIGKDESRFADICFDLIADMKVFGNAIQERQFITFKKKYESNKEYKNKVDKDIINYNKMVDTEKKELTKRIKESNSENEIIELNERLNSISKINSTDYIILLSKEEGSKQFFNFASQKMEIAVYSKINLSRSKDGFQQKELFRKRLEQKFKETVKKGGKLDRS